MGANLRFEDFELDPGAYRLRHKGVVVHLERIPFDLLCLLVERGGQTVTREEILEQVWGKGVFVDGEHGINTAVRKIRRALNDDADSPRFVATIAAKGYRFIAPVVASNGKLKANGRLPDELNPIQAPPGTALEVEKRRTLRHLPVAAILTLILATISFVRYLPLHARTHRKSPSSPERVEDLPLPSIPSIAVMPFANLSGDSREDYFSDGITEDLISNLSRLPGLFVIDRNSTFTYKGKAAKLRDVSKELGVRYVLEGSVRKAGGQVRITVQLADAAAGDELWAENYDRPLRDVFALQDEIVHRIVTTLNLQISLSQRTVLIPRTTENLEAYDDLLRGMEYMLTATSSENLRARRVLETAIELDPNYATAYALLGWNYYLGWILGLNPDPNGAQRALKLELRAAALDDSQAIAHSVLGQVYAKQGQGGRAESEARRGLALDPNSAFGYFSLAEVLNTEAKSAEALSAVKSAILLDPRNPDNYAFEEGFTFTFLKRWKEAISALKRSVTLHPDHLWSHVWLGDDYCFLGNDEDGRTETDEVERIIALSPRSAVGYVGLAVLMNDRGKPEEALIAIEKAHRLGLQKSPSFLFQPAVAYTLLRRWPESNFAFKRALTYYPCYFWAHAYLAVDYTEMGHGDAAKAEVAETLRLNPHASVDTVFPTVSLQHKALPSEIDRFRADLIKAGLR